MAMQAEVIKYVPRVSGSVAYDLEHAIPYYEQPELDTEVPKARPTVRRKVKRKVKAREEAGYGISTFALVGFFVVVALAIMILMTYVQFAEVSLEMTRLENRYAELMEEEDTLRISYESAFDINEIEEYATAALGMTKPSAYQMSGVETQTADKAEIIETDKRTEGFFSRISAGFSSILECFG